jgi:alpha/beta superfamily hydrolase
VDLNAALILHGLAGNFYSSRLMQSLARHLLELGIDVLQANTRGHDGLNWTAVGGRTEMIGAAFEVVDDCRHDIAGWTDFLHARGYRRVVLAGHSLGAIKAIYAQAHQPQPLVACIAALSTSRLNHDRFMQSSKGPKFKQWMDLAREHVGAGNGRQLMQVDFPFPAVIGAAAYLDKYGPPSRYDWTQVAARIRHPILLTFGGKEIRDNVAFDGILADLEGLKSRTADLSTQVIPEADHFYVGRRHVVSKTIANWLAEKFALTQ